VRMISMVMDVTAFLRSRQSKKKSHTQCSATGACTILIAQISPQIP
jgi:hypothetical protein